MFWKPGNEVTSLPLQMALVTSLSLFTFDIARYPSFHRGLPFLLSLLYIYNFTPHNSRFLRVANIGVVAVISVMDIKC